MRQLCRLPILLLLLIAVPALAAETPEEAALKKNFPKLRYQTFSPSSVPGLFEITVGNNVYYYHAAAEMIFVGDLITKDNRYPTQERRKALQESRLAAMAKKVGDFPLDKALKLGSGKHRIIEITNPDCGYCRRASDALGKRTDVTRYIYLLAFNKDSEKKVRYILCAKDPGKAYEEAMTGKLDEGKFAVCESKTVDALVAEHRALARQAGIDATPFFLINGKAVVGADMARIEALLNGKP